MSRHVAHRADLEHGVGARGERVVAWDRWRGLAILLMLADHLTLILEGPGFIRMTLGRLAVPMFFLLAGYLASRPGPRHLGIGLLGLALPLLVPWIDSPNVLVWWALGVCVLWLSRGAPHVRLAVLVIALTFGANGYVFLTPASYDPVNLLGLMVLGAILPASWYSAAGRLPSWVGVIGRHPVAWYVGHLLVLEGLRQVLWAS